ncbi:MAG: hypothetical protein KZQ58_08610 [gamma proteobacterium symbiont of Bathyaustriella thionipta]|nr:hypothetical protein [gamma proteobacterium symbiont of Bathyaustriella thionipta]
MSLLSIEINDAAIAVLRDGELLETLPGMAMATDDGLQFGEVAARAYALHSNWVFDHFWQELAQTPLKQSLPEVRHQADLVYHFMQYLWSKWKEDVDQVVLIVPGDYSDQQLALLAGICDALDMPLSSMVDMAVISSIHFTDSRAHIEIFRGRWVLTSLRPFAGGMVRRTVINQGGGLRAIEDSLLQHLTQEFIGHRPLVKTMHFSARL